VPVMNREGYGLKLSWPILSTSRISVEEMRQNSIGQHLSRKSKPDVWNAKQIDY
jgi:hypothetical protein